MKKAIFTLSLAIIGIASAIKTFYVEDDIKVSKVPYSVTLAEQKCLDSKKDKEHKINVHFNTSSSKVPKFEVVNGYLEKVNNLDTNQHRLLSFELLGKNKNKLKLNIQNLDTVKDEVFASTFSLNCIGLKTPVKYKLNFKRNKDFLIVEIIDFDNFPVNLENRDLNIYINMYI